MRPTFTPGHTGPTGEPATATADSVRKNIEARLRQMREGTTAGLSREDWQELGSLRDRLCKEFSASV